MLWLETFLLLQDCNFWNLPYATRLALNTIQTNIDTDIKTCIQIPLHRVPTTNKPYIKLMFYSIYIYIYIYILSNCFYIQLYDMWIQ